MTTFDPKAHWERVYAERAPSEVSWYQRAPALSLALVERSGVAKDDPIIDVGGGASTLVETVSETHLTPSGKTQRFEYHHFARRRG
jgi:hypothetical protein